MVLAVPAWHKLVNPRTRRFRGNAANGVGRELRRDQDGVRADAAVVVTVHSLPNDAERAGAPTGAFGAELRYYRTRAGLSQKDLASKATTEDLYSERTVVPAQAKACRPMRGPNVVLLLR